MIHKKITIEIDYEALGIEHKGPEAFFVTYIRDRFEDMQNPFHRPFVLIAPGGGFDHLSPREGEPVALELLKRGFNCAVLHYSLAPNTFPCALYEAAWAIDYVKDHAAEWDVNPHRVIMAGFSAGGHVAAGLATLYNEPELAAFEKNVLDRSPEDIVPDGLLLGYPVILSGKHAHEGSIKNLCGDRLEELKDSMSLEKRVDKSTPKTFIWHTFEDNSVPLENSLAFVSSLRKHEVPFEYHVFPQGCHGLSLGTADTDLKDGRHNNPQVTVWPELFENWVKNNI